MCSYSIAWIQDGLVLGDLFLPQGGDFFSTFRNYPENEFEAALEDCNFDISTIRNYIGENSDFTPYPNPVVGDMVRFKTIPRWVDVDRIRLFGPDGRLLNTWEDISLFRNPTFEGLIPGVNIFEITCGKTVVYRKVIRLHP